MLKNFGYVKQPSHEDKKFQETYMDGIRGLQGFNNPFYVKTFIKNNKRVQMIITKHKIFDVVKCFDLSVCACWAVYSSGKFRYYCLDIENTRKKYMYFQKPFKYQVNRENRVSQYQHRGYTLCKFSRLSCLSCTRTHKKYEDCEIKL